VNPLTATISGKVEVQGGGVRELKVPAYEQDIALRITIGRPE
jgi:hypothetical protein